MALKYVIVAVTIILPSMPKEEINLELILTEIRALGNRFDHLEESLNTRLDERENLIEIIAREVHEMHEILFPLPPQVADHEQRLTVIERSILKLNLATQK